MQIVQFILNTIPILISLFAEKFREEDFAKTTEELQHDSSLPVTKSFDFIVVGGGTAACVVAGRLSERFNVLLLEAGGNPPPAADVPYFSHDVARDPTINYFFKTANMTNGGVATLHTGKMLGGSGSHNALVHNRGNPKDYDNIARILNDSSWEYENVVEYFKKSENFVGKQYGEEDLGRYYGRDGPINVESQDYMPILPIWFEAAKELGFDIGDPNGFQSESFTPMNKPTRNGQRSSTYTEYIKPYENIRQNLTVIRYANVSEILIDENKEAYGVAYTRHGIPQISYASREVIVSAGVFSTPLLLMKSGIGPIDTLEAAGIPVKVPLEAIGKNVTEHAALQLGPFTVASTELFHQVLDPSDTEQLISEYRMGRGPLTYVGEGPQAFIVSSRAAPAWPNLSITIHLKPVTNFDELPTVGFYVVLGRPQSKGSIGMKAEAYKEGIRDDVQLADIDFNFLSHPDDLEDLLEGVKFAFEITETKAFKEAFNMTYAREPNPTCSDFPSDGYWRCHIRREVETWIHMVGSAKMGRDYATSDSAVLDTKFRVKGVKFLRVVDASVFPEVPNSNLNAPVIMVAEKGSDAILEDW